VNTHDVSSEPKTAESLLRIVLADIDYCERILGVVVIAWCTDAGGDARKMRKLLLQKFPNLVTPDCWGHQTQLICCDYFKIKGHYIKTAERAQEVIKWFNSHGRALGLLRVEQKLVNAGKALALILPAITRWTGHYLAFSRLLVVSQPLRICVVKEKETLITCAGQKAEMKVKAREIIRTVEDMSFWVDLAKYVHTLHVRVHADALCPSE
jgi:hypothetical protein